MQGNTTMASAVIGSAIIGAAILGGSLIIQSSVKATGERIMSQVDMTGTQIQNRLTETKSALERVASSKGGGGAAPRRGPDPSKRYTIKTDGAPAKGGNNPKVQIVEFSDFQ